MKIREFFLQGQPVEFLPTQADWLFDTAYNLKIPASGIKARHPAGVEHRPLERELLPGWQTPRLAHLFLQLFARAQTTKKAHLE